MAITIYDVAETAQVSVKTVSRVLNNEPNVRESVRLKVSEAIEQLGYRPNVAARRLRGHSSQLIIALADASLTLEHLNSSKSSHFFDRFQLGAMVRCRADGFHLLTELVEPGFAGVRAQLEGLIASLRPDGVILTPPSSDDVAVLEVLESAGVPYVRLGPTEAVERGARVYMDDRAAAAEMTRYLIDLGHKEIGFVLGDPRYPASSMRRAGFEAAMREAGLPVRPERVQPGDFTFEAGQAAARALLNAAHPPTAVFASNDEMALGAIQAAAKLNLSTPGDISVVGFDDFSDARLSVPPLTTIRQPVKEMSHAAADMLIRRKSTIEGGARHAAALLPHELVVRASAAAPASAPAKKKPAARLKAAAEPNSPA
jgi:LacI family transcriptional regulator